MYERIYCREQTDHMIGSMPDTKLVCVDMTDGVKFSVAEQRNWFVPASLKRQHLDFLREESTIYYLILEPQHV